MFAHIVDISESANPEIPPATTCQWLPKLLRATAKHRGLQKQTSLQRWMPSPDGCDQSDIPSGW